MDIRLQPQHMDCGANPKASASTSLSHHRLGPMVDQDHPVRGYLEAVRACSRRYLGVGPEEQHLDKTEAEIVSQCTRLAGNGGHMDRAPLVRWLASARPLHPGRYLELLSTREQMGGGACV